MPKYVLTLSGSDRLQFAEDMACIQPSYIVYHYSASAGWFHVDLDITDESLSFLSLKYELISVRPIRNGDNFRSWNSSMNRYEI